MNRTRRRLLGATMALSAPWARAQRTELRVVYYESFPPFSFGKGGTVSGLFVDVVNEALGKRANVVLTHSGLPWVRAQEMVQQGEADAFVTLVTPQRRGYANSANVPIYNADIRVYAAADHPRLAALRSVTDPSGFAPYTLATYLGNSLGASAFGHMQVRYVGTAEGSVEMALAHRVDLAPGEPLQMRSYLRNLGVAPDNMVRLDPVLAKNQYFLQIGKRYPHPELLAECDRALRAMRADGTLDAIIARYQD